MKLIPTQCCALLQLSADDDTPISHIKATVEHLKEEATTKKWFPDSGVGGFRCVFCITVPGEDKLVEKLKTLGFEPGKQFNRRSGYPQTGLLTMWTLDW